VIASILFFSRNRAMQMHAALESYCRYCEYADAATITVLYRADTDQYKRQYDILAKRWPGVRWQQETAFAANFGLWLGHDSEHSALWVDDIIFVRPWSWKDVRETLKQQPDAIGFALRFGRGLNWHYLRQFSHGEPAEWKKAKGAKSVLYYEWGLAPREYDYPLEVSSSIYRTAELHDLLRCLPKGPANPNELEAMLSGLRPKMARILPHVLCYDTPRAFMLPCNRVQDVYANAAGREYGYTTEQLADLFDIGQKIDISEFDDIAINSTHMERPSGFVDA